MACGQTESAWTVHEGELDSADVRALLAEHFAEMRSASPPSACHVMEADQLRHPAIRFFSLREDGVLLGIGALKDIESGHGEVKSMRTAKAALGRGVGRFILDHVIGEARDAGMTRLSLETGNVALFAPANQLYASAGFTRCGPFGGYADTDFTHFYTRAI
jgi:putative acetyltransferase